MPALSKPPPRLAWTMWGLGAALFLIGFFHRVAPAVMTTNLINDFGLSAAALGNLSAFYFYSYVAMQIPTGILADTRGPRRLMAAGAFVTAIGTLLFALAPSFLWAGLGRFLIGGAVAVAYVGMLKLAVHWLPPHQFALSSGLALLVGIIGAIVAGVPLQLLVDLFDWRTVMLVSAILPLGVGVFIWLFIRDDPQEKGYASYAPILDTGPSQSGQSNGVISGIGEVLHYRNSRLLTLIPGGLSGSVLTFAGLWGVPYLMTHYNLPATQAAALGSVLLVAWAIGGPIMGTLSDRIGRRKPLYIAGIAGAMAAWSIIIFIPGLPGPALILLLAVAGFSSGCMVIGYAFAKESVPPHLAGTVSGLYNMGVLLGPMFLQPAVGWMLDLRWQGHLQNGLRIYELPAFQAGFSLMLAWMVLAFILIFFTRETYCQQITQQGLRR